MSRMSSSTAVCICVAAVVGFMVVTYPACLRRSHEVPTTPTVSTPEEHVVVMDDEEYRMYCMWTNTSGWYMMKYPEEFGSNGWEMIR